MEYTQLDTTARLNMVRQRISVLENQFFQVNLRINAPDPNQPISDMDNQLVSQLQNSLDTLHAMEQELLGTPTRTGATPTPTPAAT